MELYLTVTPDDTKEYPLHSHDVYEIIFYISGKGYLHTESADYPFSEGSIAIIPPRFKHRSVSKDGFKNICVHTDDVLLDENDVVFLSDNSAHDGEVLVKMLMRAYFGNINKTCALTLNLYYAYRETVLSIRGGKDVVLFEKIKSEFTKNISNMNFSPYTAFENKGYSVDYLRALFKKKFGMTPTAYFANLKISYAKNLFDAYGGKLKVNEIALMCGYADALYFSKIFKKTTGLSPMQYIKSKDKE